MYRVSNSITIYALMLIGGAVLAMVWANTAQESYFRFVEFVIWPDAPFGAVYDDGNGQIVRALSLQFLANEMLMALFFAVAAKEVWEALILKNGALRGKKAATPLVASLGGMIGPIAVYLGMGLYLGSDTYDALTQGWAVPTATDIALAYLVGRVVFGAGHPALRFLLLLAIADDMAGLLIVAMFYPQAEVAPVWLLLSLAVALTVYLLANWLPRRLDRGDQLRRRSTWVRKKLSVWPYVIAGGISWYAFMRAGVHPAVGLLPIVPAIPHADRAFGIFAAAEQHLHDLLNQAEQALKYPVALILGLYALINAGVTFDALDKVTWLVFAGLLVGKPLGIALFGWAAAVLLRFGLPAGMRMADLAVVGCVAAVGFTVPLFVATVAFEPGLAQDAAKVGVLFSFLAALLAIVVGWLAHVEKREF